MATLQLPAPPAPERVAPAALRRPSVAVVDAIALFEAALEARVPFGTSALDVDTGVLASTPTLRRAAPRAPAGVATTRTDWEAEDPGRWRTRILAAAGSVVATAASVGAIALAL